MQVKFRFGALMSTTINYSSNSKTVTADWHEPSAGVLPVVVVSYGTEGMNAPFDRLIDDYCVGLLQSCRLLQLKRNVCSGRIGVESDDPSASDGHTYRRIAIAAKSREASKLVVGILCKLPCQCSDH